MKSGTFSGHIQRTSLARILGLLIPLAGLLTGCMGKRLAFEPGTPLGNAVLPDGEEGTRADGTDIGDIYTVNLVTQAQSGYPNIAANMLPYTGTPAAIGSPSVDAQAPFYFDYTYPPNNFKLAEAHVILDTSRDTSGTEGIFIDGVLSGGAPTNMVRGDPACNGVAGCSTAPSAIEYRTYIGNGDVTKENGYYNDWSRTHYLAGARNTFDLNLVKLIDKTPLTQQDVLNDGFLQGITGDDSPVYANTFLLIKGYTISKAALTCSPSPDYSFANDILHEDGNSIGTAAFNGTVRTPFESVSATPTNGVVESIEWYHDANFPQVDKNDIDLAHAYITLKVKKNTTVYAKAAIVVNGIGISESGFDRTSASSAVESWDDSVGATSAWNTFVSSLPDGALSANVQIDLVALYGASTVRDLISQGKLNIALAGSLVLAQASNATRLGDGTTTRTGATQITGPVLHLDGTFSTQLCTVPDNPDSPLNDSGALPSDVGDNKSPVVSSTQASEVTSSSAVIQWLTDEPATSQIGYGIGNTNTTSTDDTNLTTFHRVVLSGLSPYKVYTYRVITSDSKGNQTSTATKTFQTLR